MLHSDAPLPLNVDQSSPHNAMPLRRNLVVAFSDLSNSTDIAADIEPEIYAELLQKMRDLFQRIIPKHGGEIVRIDGDGVLYIFGYPISHEDAGRRAAEAALDLHIAVRALESSLATKGKSICLHTGIHSGIVLLSAGDLVRGRYEILGDATNIAARLCDFASSDEIIISEVTLGGELSFFNAGPRQKIQVAGRTGAVPAYQLLSKADLPQHLAARRRPGVASFVGRLAELERLQHWLDECKVGSSRVVAIEGAAGIGKSRLANAFLESAACGSFRVHRGYCEAYLGAQTLQPIAQILQSVLAETLGEAAADSDAIAAYLGAIDPDIIETLMPLLMRGNSKPVPSGFSLEILVAALTILLTHEALTKPIILFFDDWQWADDASQQILNALISNIPRSIFFLLSTRQSDANYLEAENYISLPLSPLGHDDVVTAIEGLLISADPFLVKRIGENAGGNPLYIEELCHAIINEEDVLVAGERSAWLEMLVQSRFSRLSGPLSELVQSAAVIGHIIPAWLFEEITGVARDSEHLRMLADEDFIYESETSGLLRFKHGITRDAIYQTVGMRERRALHGKIAAALATKYQTEGESPYIEALAYHNRAAGNEELALHYANLAGDVALAASALDRAQGQYQAAIEIVTQMDYTQERSTLFNRAVHRFGLASVADPSADQIAILAAAAAYAQMHDNIAGFTACNYWLGTICYGMGEAKASIQYLLTALHTASTLNSSRMKAQLIANLGQSYSAAGEYARAASNLEIAIGMMNGNLVKARQQAAFPEVGYAYALACRGFLFADQGDFEKAAGCYDKANDILRGSKEPLRGSVVTQLAAVSLWQGKYDEACEHAETGVTIGQACRSRYYVIMSSALKAYAQWQVAREEASVAELVKAARWFMSGASEQRTSLCYGWLAEIMADKGEEADARFYAAQALIRARKGDRIGEAMACRAMAKLAAQGHGARSYIHYLGLAENSAKARQSKREAALNQSCEAAIMLGAGQKAAALQKLADVQKSFAQMGMHKFAADTEQLIITNR